MPKVLLVFLFHRDVFVINLKIKGQYGYSSVGGDSSFLWTPKSTKRAYNIAS